MNNKIYQWASLLVETQEEPSYNDVLAIAERMGISSEDVMSSQDYESLSQLDKEEIYKKAKLINGSDFKDFNNDDIENDKEADFLANTNAQILPSGNKVYVNYIETDFMKAGKADRDLVDIREVKVFPSMDKAKKFVASRLRMDREKYGKQIEDFKVIDTEDEIFPKEIKEVDQNAIMLQCKDFEAKEGGIENPKYYKYNGEVKTAQELAKELNMSYSSFMSKVKKGIKGVEGVEEPADKKTNNLPPNTKYDYVKVNRVFTYIIYTSDETVPMVDWMSELADAISWAALSPEEQAVQKRRKDRIADQKSREFSQSREMNKKLRDKTIQSEPDDDDFTFDPETDRTEPGDDAGITPDDQGSDEDDYGENWKQAQRRSTDYYDDRDDTDDYGYDTKDYDYNRHGDRW